MGLYKGESYSEDEWKDKNINAATGKPFGQAGEEAVQGKAQDWRNEGSPVPGTKAPEDNRSLASQLFDWANTPAGNAVIGGLGLAGLAAAGTGIRDRMRRQGDTGPKIDPTFNEPPPPPPPNNPPSGSRFTPTDVTDVASRPAGTDRLQLPGPTPVVEPPAAPAKVAPTGIPTPQPYQGAGLQQPPMTYGPTTLTGAPEGVPNPLGAAPPANAPAPVAPLTDKQRLEKARADLAELKLQQAKDAATNLQSQQGKPTSDAELSMIKKSEEAKIDKEVYARQAAANKALAPAPVAPAAPVAQAPAAPVAPVVAQAAAPTATPAVAPLAPAPEALAAAQQAEAQKQASAPAPEPEPKPTTEKPKRRSAEEVAASKSAKPFESAKSSFLNNLGAKDSAEMDAKARAALGVLKEEVFAGEKVKQTKSHVNEEWSKAKAFILANPGKFDPEIVARQQKSGEQLKSEARLRKAAELAAAMAGGSSGGGGMAGGPRLGPGVGGLTQGAGGDISKLNPMKLMQ